tara:strand:- start:466 stop:714 length:249 start_codon:yes stop_codon:yes gene_type:complete
MTLKDGKDSIENKEFNDQTSKDVLNSEPNDNSQSNINSDYQFGWNNYSEITNGRFAMLGLIAIIIIEIISKKSFLNWAGIIH